MNRMRISLAIILVLLLTAACGGGNEEPTPEPPAATVAPSPTDEPTAEPEPTEEPADEVSALESPLASTSALESPLAAPFDSPLSIPASIPDMSELEVAEPTDETGTVSGQILGLATDGQVKPIPNVVIGLARLVPDPDGEGSIAAAYDAAVAPQSPTDEFGRFIITDVPAGEYGVILDSVLNQSLLLYPDRQESLTIMVEEGELLELETLIYNRLPISGFAN